MKKIVLLLFSVLLAAVDGNAQANVLTWDPGASQQGTEVYTHPNSNAGSYLFEITTETNSNSVGLWHSVLNVASGEANLYMHTSASVSTSNYQLKSERVGDDTIVQTLTAGQTYYILVEAQAGASWSLFAGDVHVQPLAWDPGMADAGTAAFTNATTEGGAYYFKLVTENADLAAWRTALRVESGEADLYIRQSGLPYTNSASSYFSDSSAGIGSDGFTRYLSESSGAGQQWYILVDAQDGASWSLLSGDVYAQDLGVLATNASSGSGLAEIPPEGVRYFKTTIPPDALAWRLWLKDAAGAGSLLENFYVRHGLAPLASGSYDHAVYNQTLLVPDYLQPGSPDAYYVGVTGEPGEQFQLDSRQQEIIDVAYDSTLASQSASGFRFKTYRVSVPPEQIAWEVTAEPLGGTNPNLAIRENRVPNRFNNDAFSEVVNTTADESVTLVPPTLTDGTFYITAYGGADFSFNLRNREPILTPIAYTSSVINDDPNRAGWRYYSITNIAEQVGQLGWLLELDNHVPGSEIAIRRNDLPGRWNYRPNDNGSVSVGGHRDLFSTSGFLQDNRHEADIWYVGIYSPAAPLGAFSLDSSSSHAPETAMDGFSASHVSLVPGRWNFYYVNVPVQLSGEEVLGWELRVTEWSGSKPTMVVCRDQLPNGTATTSGSYKWGSQNLQRNPHEGDMWRSGNQWATSSDDWTGLYQDPGNPERYPQYLLSMAMGNPLEPGSYYIGFYNSGTTTGTFSFVSRAIGEGMTYDPEPIAFDGGSATMTNLEPRAVAYYEIDVPSNRPSWRLQLENTLGDSELFIRKDKVPTLGTVTRLDKPGDEHQIRLPANNSEMVDPGRYYLMVVGEGQYPSHPTIGTNKSAAVLHSHGEAVVEQLGSLPVAGELVVSNGYGAGQVNLMQFEVPDGVLALEVSLEDKLGNPWVRMRPDEHLVSSAYRGYGIADGWGPSYTIDDFLTIANPATGIWSVVVQDPNYYPEQLLDGSYTLRITTVGATEIPFEGGGDTDAMVPPGEWKYYHLDIPAQISGEDVLGWDLRLNEWSGSRPAMVVRRDFLPSGTGTTSGSYRWGTKHAEQTPSEGSLWKSGNQWATGAYDGLDWFRSSYDLGNPNLFPSYRLSMAMGSPLEPGSYYIGFYNGGSVTSSYSFTSSAIGNGMTYDPQPIAFDGGSATITNLSPRGVAYYEIDVPTNQPSWRLHLENTLGESEFFVRRGAVPTMAAYGGGGIHKPGDEHHLVLPVNNEDYIESGLHYLMVVGEGQNPSHATSSVGTNESAAVLHSYSEVLVEQLGSLAVAGELVQSNGYMAGRVNLMQFEVPEGVLALEVSLEDTVGNPRLLMRRDEHFSGAGGSYYGTQGSWSAHYNTDDLLTIANPATGTWSVVVQDPTGTSYGEDLVDGSYSLRLTTVGAIEIPLDNGGDTNAMVAPGEWKYYHLDVPAQISGEDVLGWELRVTEWSGSKPTMVICRDLLPNGTATTSGSYDWGTTHGEQTPATGSRWWSGNQWASNGGDWTRYYYDSGDPNLFPSYRLSMAMGSPLEPGSYYIGFYNSGSVTSSYSFTSSAIGNGMTYDPQPIAFDGGSATITNLSPRAVAYYTVDVPSNQPSWRLQLENTLGDSSLFIRKGMVPTLGAVTRLDKPGDEHQVRLPDTYSESVDPGLHYLMVVGEGQNPSLSTYTIGTNECAAVLHSHGEAVVEQLGSLPVAGELVLSNGYFAGQVNLMQFEVPEGVLALEVRLEDKVGNPWMRLRNDSHLTSAGFYGTLGGWSGSYQSYDFLTIANPATGTWSMVLQDPVSYSYPERLTNGLYTLVIKDLTPLPVNFDPRQNTNGLINTASDLISDGQHRYYQVEVPDALDGEPVIGWYLRTIAAQGAAKISVKKDALPPGDYYLSNGETAATSPSVILTTPFLTPGTWYVDVKAVGETEFTLISESVVPSRSWAMPAFGEGVAAPGLGAGIFADTGVDASGHPLPIDQGIDLELGYYHVYAIEVPAGNAGLLHAQLEAISGDPDLYVRKGAVPSIDNDEDGAGTLYDYSLNNNQYTEYGSWVPADGRTATFLEPGIWYLTVKADGNSNARYRLKLSSGNADPGSKVQDLALEGGSYTAQPLASGDLRHYRVVIPDVPPEEWQISYSQQLGDVDLYIRDTIPSGNDPTYSSYFYDWDTDQKNQGTARPSFPTAGTHSVGIPPLRPGHVYYLSFKANSDASFSVSSATSGGSVNLPLINFESGFVSTNLPAGASVTYRIDAPNMECVWRHSTTNSANVKVYLEQGTVPSETSQDHWYSTSGNSALKKFLTPGAPWPWRSSQSYFLTAVNTGSSPEPFVLVMDGSTVPEVPQNLSASDGDYTGVVYMTWDGLSGYAVDVWRSTVNNTSTAVHIGGNTYGNASFYDYYADPGTLYYYWVSVDGATNTDWFSTVDSGWRMDSSWMNQYYPGGNPGSGADTDGDGFDSKSEFVAGTDPTNIASFFAITNAWSDPAGFVIDWQSVSGRVYTVEWADSLTNDFQPLESGIGYPQNSYTDTVHATEGEGFYNLNVELGN